MKYRFFSITATFVLTLLLQTQIALASQEPLPPAPPSPPPFPPFSLLVNGQKITTDQDPLFINGVLFIPLRATLEALGSKVEWDAQRETAMVDHQGLRLGLYPGRNDVLLNDRVISLGSPCKLEKERLLVPGQVFSEILDMDISWDPEHHFVFVN
ncbi:copper amine oxidase N-terminal domain-containing protein [Desulforamulus ruminis]|uniref:Copper amine oxidase-like domain-containing protein n=1 Tax=Desulforamulus ruminis (strain ATCC 23193 / DSM 2154 / NCIMB 8452 / DL) TaxID=696281 RepID=F6DU26_DESRL|nr:copper amine oxidase N-terminal domain-containing protein [Desulforamulus ruminis]AEG60101.1 copper amine oxidase-like domain-containing protein [Desulforamulus ruminis DSM 2154]